MYQALVNAQDERRKTGAKGNGFYFIFEYGQGLRDTGFFKDEGLDGAQTVVILKGINP